MNIKRLSLDGANETLKEILKGIDNHLTRNPEDAMVLLDKIKTEVLDPLSEDDFFGTEGWEHAFGIE
jgi:hypothetical protein